MKAQGFSREERLTARREFEAVHQGGKRVRTSPFLHARILKRPEKPARLGLSVSKKIGNAVVRNRVKRRLREIFRRNKMVAARGADVVLAAGRGIQDLPYGELEKIYLGFWDLDWSCKS